MSIRLVARDHPEADGRTGCTTDRWWRYVIPLECGESLILDVGKGTHDALLSILTSEALQLTGFQSQIEEIHESHKIAK